MELKHRHDWRKLISVAYILAFAVYVAIGLQPAEAKHYDVSGDILIPAIDLISDVTTLTLHDNKLDTPDTIVGEYSRNASKTFLIGHSSTVFKDLYKIKASDRIYYDNTEYKVVGLETLEKSEIDMNAVLAPAKKQTLVIMTCAGESLGNGDATHRLIVTAVKI